MTVTTAHLKDTAQLLTNEYLLHYPAKAAREIANLPLTEAAELLAEQALHLQVSLYNHLPAGLSENLLAQWPHEQTQALLEKLDIHKAAAILSRLDDTYREQLFARWEQDKRNLAAEFRELLSYPPDSAGQLMDPKIHLFFSNLTAEQALQQIKMRHPEKMDALFVVNKEELLLGRLEIGDLVLADPRDKLDSLMKPIAYFFSTLDSKEEVIEKFEGIKINVIPVLNIHDHIVGVIRDIDIYQEAKQELASDMAMMVGASKEEKALSSSWFAVRKRMPWLQINLLTAFAAAAVVGAFEDLIAQFTALAILLPVAAGQSGNAGAQALAVTMRGLTLKEITTRHWWQVFRKESLVGFLNGIAVAVTCSIGVLAWSGSVGLALVMILAMIASLTIACGSGALVPMLLKKFGMDPAQSSSIVLTTVTDIAGFMSFLGIATLLSGMLSGAG